MVQTELNFQSNPFMDDYTSYAATRCGREAYQFDMDNPKIMEYFIRFADEVRRKGFRKYSANAIFERIRWHVSIETTDGEFKISNNHRAYYARRLMAIDGRFEGFFCVKGARCS